MSRAVRRVAVAAVAAVALLFAGCSRASVTPLPGVTGNPPTAASSSAQTSQPPGASAAQSSPGVGSIVQPVAQGFPPLTFVANSGDGSGALYVVAQGGQIYQLNQGESVAGSPWLDISDRISSGGERGLLGVAFHPDFTDNGRFFVDYTDLNGNTVISEFQRAADGTVDPKAEKILLQQTQPFANHNGGMLAFGPDGYLYIGFGDGGSGGDPNGNGQKLDVLLGKILRIDVDSGVPYGIPASNPFQPDNEHNARAEIWDWGVRNPWRFSFDRQSRALFIGDVGQNQTEEIDVELAGNGDHNYGWNIMEGDHCYAATTCDQTGLTPPVATYSHDLGCSVIGGYVYRGTRFPAFDGKYFFSDFCSGTIWTLDADEAVAGVPVAPQKLGQVSFSVTSFGEGEAGELYIVDAGGTIYSLVQP